MASKPERVLLPTNVVPKAYTIKLHNIDLTHFTFDGVCARMCCAFVCAVCVSKRTTTTTRKKKR